MKFAASMAIALAILGATTLAEAQAVSVTGGQVRGAMLEKGGAVFKGIPFSAAPVGELRWREPMPVEPWMGVRDGTKFGPACMQKPNAVVGPNAVLPPPAEDCLYLNVWAPEWPSRSPKAVMVFIPGGGNYAGAASQDIYDSDSLAQHGVVLVTVNYRLGTFGFFSHPSLTRESPNHASGNQGLLDQIAALKWVRDNIASFGGDPENVTVFGESAGSLDVSVLMTSPLSAGLFKRVIGQSGAVILAGQPSSLSQAEERGAGLAAKWNVAAGASAADLRAVSAADILDTDPDYARAGQNFPNLGISVDGYVLPKKPAEVFAAGEERRVALLLGSNTRDHVPPAPADLRAAIEFGYGPLSPRAHSLYVGDSDPLYGPPAEQWVTDASFRCPAVAQLIWHTASGNPSFQFEFARVPPGREEVGAPHASELTYVFGTLDRGIVGVVGGPLPRVPANAVDRQVSDVMQRYWTNFAKTGDPNGAGLPVWPKFDPTRRAYVQFTDAGPIANEGLRRAYCDLFIENVKRQMAH
jgi:para-nitrobenzyl esterase